MRSFAAAATFLLLLATGARADEWRSTAESRVTVHVLKKGLFSAFAHDHHFEVTDWSATARLGERSFADASVEVVLSASSLRDRQPALSEEDRRKVNAQAAGPEVLDAERHPRIVFRSGRFEVAPGGTDGRVRGTLHGTLTARGRSVPAQLPIEAEHDGETWRVRGSTSVRQTDLGIRPFSGFGGTVGVRDELRIDVSLELARAGRPDPPPRAVAPR